MAENEAKRDSRKAMARSTAPNEPPTPIAAPRTSASGRRKDAVPDRIDIRDWFYQPSLDRLPDTVVNCDRVPHVLDQGREGACTGFALAAVINFLRSDGRAKSGSVSPQMLYEMARRYDEWPGEEYEGSSARGAMKGWVAHGVCPVDVWPADKKGPEHFTPEIVGVARKVPGGAFYRVMHRQIRDVHAAIADVGAVYVTLMVHDGWDEPGPNTAKVTYGDAGKSRSISLPVIERRGRASSGHAIALVGYSQQGFIVQNSWGKGWGKGGFALLPYEDFLLHATDVWVAQVGVPLEIDLWQTGDPDTTAGLQRAGSTIPLSEIRPYVVDLGNNGKLSNSGQYWTTRADVERLFNEIIPERTKEWAKKRILFYIHGGLNDEDAAARRIIAFRDVLLENEIYPVHIMWESGVLESVTSMLCDLVTPDDERAASVTDWLKRTRAALTEAKDWTFEMTAAVPGTKLWKEMKENGRLASIGEVGGMSIIADVVAKAAANMSDADRKKWEFHVTGHSAGAIVTAHAMQLLVKAGFDFKTLQLFAPAITVEDFDTLVVPTIKAGLCPVPRTYVLRNEEELDDTVGPYDKSLLYLVSNAFEGQRGKPILGMKTFLEKDVRIRNLLGATLVTSNPSIKKAAYPFSSSRTHGGFDNDPPTMNSMIWHIKGGKNPKPQFELRHLQY
jgi:hypothetical protein